MSGPVVRARDQAGFSRRGFIGSIAAAGAIAALPMRAMAVPKIAKPILSGTPTVSPPLSVERGAWEAQPRNLTWHLNGKPVARGASYVLGQ